MGIENVNKPEEVFIGREREIAEFTQWLTKQDPEAPRILSLYAAETVPSKQGGVGKTQLLHKFIAIARHLLPNIVIAHIDFFNIASHDGIAIAQSVVAAFKEIYPDGDTSRSEEELRRYDRALHKKEDVVEIHSLLADALIEDLHRLNDKVNSTGKDLLLFFDTYERVEDNPLVAVIRRGQTFPDDYDLANTRIVIAGRHAIDFNHINWHGREKEVQSMPVYPFTLLETETYFELLANVHISIQLGQMQALHECTEGRPILIGLVNDMLTQGVSKVGELISMPKETFEESLVAKINELGRPIDTIILFMAHVYHRFNLTLLNWILAEKDLSDLVAEGDRERTLQQLLSLSFVRRPDSGDNFALHDEMLPLVNRYCWNQDPNRIFRIALSQSVIKYYERELQQIPSEQLKQTYTVELLHHKLYIDPENGYQYFTENFSRAVNLRLNSFSRSLLSEVQQFKEQLSEAQLYALKYYEARLLQKEEEPAQALFLLEELERLKQDNKQWFDKNRPDILFEKGVAYRQLNRYSDAITCFQASMKIEKQRGRLSEYAYLLSWLGSVYEKKGVFDTALLNYEEGLAVHKQLHEKRACASALVKISDVYLLQGRVEEALLRARTSWHIRNELFEQGEISEVYVGWSLCSIGKVYYQVKDLANANTTFQDTLDIFTRTRNKEGLATIYNLLGELSLDQDALPYARQWFESARSVSLNIDTKSQIRSLNKLGWLFVLEEQYQKAITSLQQALKLAKTIHDEYQQAESLIDLAEAFKRSGQEEESRRARQEAREICQQYHYYYLLGLSSSSEGDIYYDIHDYKKAFQSYGEACYYMTQYNDLEYNKGLRKLTEALLNVPSEEINAVVDQLVTYWSSQGANKSHPAFTRSCEEIRGLLGF